LNDDPNDWPWSGDKPWLVAGEVIPGNPPQQEFYICYTGGAIAVCLRSTNGGQTWRGGGIKIDDEWVYGRFPGPAPQADGSLYLACRDSDVIFFLHGEDPEDPNDPMIWDYLRAGLSQPLEVAFYADHLYNYLPMPNNYFVANLFPLLAADPGVDPNDPDVLYLVYHDIADPNEPNDPNVTDVDVDVFLHKLTEQENGTWLAGGRVQVNDSDDPNAASPTDQFHPTVTVTPGPTPEETRVHVIFYDDRRFDEQIDAPADPNDPNDPYYRPKFDVYYAYSEDAGESFEPQDDELLFLEDPEDPNDPAAVDYTVLDPNDPDFILKDYIGIARQAEGAGYRIWTSYMGMYADDPTEHKSVIWSSQIRWASP
jgi:hypothetical protein